MMNWSRKYSERKLPAIDFSRWQNLIYYCWSNANVTIDDAQIDTLQVAPINGKVTVKAGTHVGTINIAYGTSTPNENRLAKLVIEDGAIVDKIVFENVEYTLEAWRNRTTTNP